MTNWDGKALCIIKTTSVAIEPSNIITEEYAALEGECDRSLVYWQYVHWDYYHEESKNTSYNSRKSMPIVCEISKVVFKHAGDR